MINRLILRYISTPLISLILFLCNSGDKGGLGYKELFPHKFRFYVEINTRIRGLENKKKAYHFQEKLQLALSSYLKNMLKAFVFV